jgi:hypothetical protein
VLRGRSITWHPAGWSRLGAYDDREVLAAAHEAQAWRFFNKVKLHGELVDLALKGCDLGFVLRDDRCLGLFGAELPTVLLLQPELNQIGRQGVRPCRIAPADSAAADILAKLNLELRRVAPAWTS